MIADRKPVCAHTPRQGRNAGVRCAKPARNNSKFCHNHRYKEKTQIRPSDAVGYRPDNLVGPEKPTNRPSSNEFFRAEGSTAGVGDVIERYLNAKNTEEELSIERDQPHHPASEGLDGNSAQPSEVNVSAKALADEIARSYDQSTISDLLFNVNVLGYDTLERLTGIYGGNHGWNLRGVTRDMLEKEAQYRKALLAVYLEYEGELSQYLSPVTILCLLNAQTISLRALSNLEDLKKRNSTSSQPSPQSEARSGSSSEAHSGSSSAGSSDVITEL